MSRGDRIERGFRLIRDLCLALTPLAVAFVGNWFATALKEREQRGRFVELALEILAKPPAAPDSTAQPVREWAVQIVSQYSGIPLGEKATESLVQKTAFPASIRHTGVRMLYGYPVSPDSKEPVEVALSAGRDFVSFILNFDGVAIHSNPEHPTIIGDARTVAGKSLEIIGTGFHTDGDSMKVMCFVSGGLRDLPLSFEQPARPRCPIDPFRITLNFVTGK